MPSVYIDRLPPNHRTLLHRYFDAYQQAASITDPRLLNLPHPKRAQVGDVLHHEMAFLEAVAPAFITEIKTGHLSLDMGIGMLLHRYPDLCSEVYQGSREVLDALVLRTLVYYGHVRIFQTTDALESMLQATDLGDDLPASLFQTPFPNIFIRFGQDHRFPRSLTDPASGEHAIEGCYVFSGDVASYNDPNHIVRGFRLMIFGSPAGKSGLYDDTFTHIAVPIFDETMAIGELVQHSVDNFLSQNLNVRNPDVFAAIAKHVAKFLLYLGLKDARQAPTLEATALARQIAAIKSPAKRAKAARQMDRVFDRIVVGPTHIAAPSGHLDTGRSVSAHLRRGHFRMQPYGPQHALRRPVWIAPTLVGNDNAPTGHDYLVR